MKLLLIILVILFSYSNIISQNLPEPTPYPLISDSLLTTIEFDNYLDIILNNPKDSMTIPDKLSDYKYRYFTSCPYDFWIDSGHYADTLQFICTNNIYKAEHPKEITPTQLIADRSEKTEDLCYPSAFLPGNQYFYGYHRVNVISFNQRRYLIINVNLENMAIARGSMSPGIDFSYFFER